MGSRIDSSGLDHDSRCWFLLLRVTAAEECALDDLPEHDDRRRGVVPGLSPFILARDHQHPYIPSTS